MEEEEEHLVCSVGARAVEHDATGLLLTSLL
jgi:hypothetical protein